MIHTDGAPTIANAPVRELPEPGRELPAADLGAALLQRSYSGLKVNLFHSHGACVIQVEDHDGLHEAFVPNALALDAFEHPYVYLAR